MGAASSDIPSSEAWFLCARGHVAILPKTVSLEPIISSPTCLSRDIQSEEYRLPENNIMHSSRNCWRFGGPAPFYSCSLEMGVEGFFEAPVISTKLHDVISRKSVFLPTAWSHIALILISHISATPWRKSDLGFFFLATLSLFNGEFCFI